MVVAAAVAVVDPTVVAAAVAVCALIVVVVQFSMSNVIVSQASNKEARVTHLPDNTW